ncbi:MAG TPA: CAP domain-containing protein, partial [Candidatus Paceibacterota bacterium]|nr:CAP domain-containing protein [Candidatus Paceibacterota bacterium]
FNDSKDVVDAWMASPTHHANIVKPQYQEMGVGIANGMYKGASATFVVQFFASPAVAQIKTAESSPKVSSIPQTQAQASVAGAEVEPAPVQVTQAELQPPAALTPAPKQSFMQSVARILANAFDTSRTGGTWALASIAAVLITVLALTFFVRIQVQPTDLLIPGIAVALVAVVLLGANAKFLPAQTQSASVAAYGQGEVGDAAATAHINVVFPQGE